MTIRTLARGPLPGSEAGDAVGHRSAAMANASYASSSARWKSPRKPL
jgi:hypothetical protein